MKIDNFFTRFAKSVLGEKTYKKVLHPSKEVFLNNHLPIIESSDLEKSITAIFCHPQLYRENC